MNTVDKSSAAFFEEKYASLKDPWDFEGSSYEQGRYLSIMRALDGRRWKSALEPGCSIGVLTEQLAPFCDNLISLDFSPTAIQSARIRCARFEHVQLRCQGLQEIASFGSYDLIVLSEIGYYSAESCWNELTDRIARELKHGATLLAAHWTGYSEDHEISGDRVHEILKGQQALKVVRSERHAGFRLDKLEKL